MVNALKIALVSHSFLPQVGGVEVAVHHLGCRLAARGHRVEVITAFRTQRPSSNSGYRVRFYPRTPREILQGPVLAAWLWGLQRQHAYDVIHFHKAPLAYFAVGSGLQRRVPILITTHGGDVQVYPELNYGDRMEARWDRRITTALQQAAAVTAISRNTRRIYEQMGIPAERIFEVPNGVDLQRFETQMPDIRPQLGVPHQTRLILAVGRGNPIKGYAHLMRAADLLNRRGLDFRLLLAGRQTDDLIADIKNLGLGQRVLLAGQTRAKDPAPGEAGSLELPDDRLLAIYQAADLMVSTSLLEGLPLVLLEAMAAGLPIVASDVPGNQDLVHPEQNGLLVPAGDPPAMADAMAQVLEDPARCQTMGAASRQLVRAFSWERIAALYEQIYGRLNHRL